jgi:hypothetical protein
VSESKLGKPVIIGIIAVALVGSLFLIPNPSGVWVCDLSVTLSGTYKTGPLMGEWIEGFSVTASPVHWRRPAILDVLAWNSPQLTWLWPTKIGFDVFLIDSEGGVHGPYKASVDIPTWTNEKPFTVNLIAQNVPEGTYTLKIDSSMTIQISIFEGTNTVTKTITVSHGGI